MFEAISHFFYLVLYQPLFNCLVILYNYIPGHDFGLAVIILTVVIRLLLYPSSAKAVNSQKNLQKLQPKVKELQTKYKDDREKQAREILELYKTEKINPFSGILVQLPMLIVLIALYNVFWAGFDPKQLEILYSFVSNPGQINPLFLNLINLSKPSLFLAIIAGAVQYFQTRMLTVVKAKDGKDGKEDKKDLDPASIMQKQMVFILPVFTIIILISLPSALGLYWTVSGLFSIAQQYIIFRSTKI